MLKGRSLKPHTFGLPVKLEIGKTLDLALKRRPDTRRIVVVAGDDEACCTRVALAREALGRYAGELDVQYPVGLTLADRG